MATTAEQVAQLQAQNNKMYQESAREQMAFQERMSNTAHLRETKDLLAAGLNPVLSATGGQGASTPNGAQADVDTQSMVNYLLTEMNNENARAMNNAQVAAQRYAADMSYRAAQVAANAQMYAADKQANNSILGWMTNAIANPTSDQGRAARYLLNALGINVPQNPTQQTANGLVNKAVDVMSSISYKKAENLLYAAAHTPTQYSLLRQNADHIAEFFKLSPNGNTLWALFTRIILHSDYK